MCLGLLGDNVDFFLAMKMLTFLVQTVGFRYWQSDLQLMFTKKDTQKNVG